MKSYIVAVLIFMSPLLPSSIFAQGQLPQAADWESEAARQFIFAEIALGCSYTTQDEVIPIPQSASRPAS
jgi:hypothetical protein